MKHLVETGMKPASFTTMSRHERQGEGCAPEEKLIYGEKINPWNVWCEELRLLQDQLPIGGSPTTHRPSIHLLRCDQEGQNLFRIVDAGESRPTAARSTYGTTWKRNSKSFDEHGEPGSTSMRYDWYQSRLIKMGRPKPWHLLSCAQASNFSMGVGCVTIMQARYNPI